MKKRIKKPIFVFFPVAALCLAAVAVFVYLYFYMPRDTSDGYRYAYRMDNVLEKYEDFAEVAELDDSFPVPGLSRTNLTISARINDHGNIIRYGKYVRRSSRQMIPQGICFAQDYILISAYDADGDYPSVIYVMDLETRQYLTTIILSDKNHVGGITYDGSAVWIAKSGDHALSMICYDRICQAVSAGEDSVAVDYDETYAISCRASFVTWYDGLLWVGVFQKSSDSVSVLRGFSFEESGGAKGLFQQEELFLPELANGADIQKVNGQVCLVVDSSHGRKNSSTVHVYELHMDENNYENAVCELKREYEFPPMLEEVEFYQDKIYFVFESAAAKYSKNRAYRCKYPVDRVVAVSQEKFLDWMQDDYVEEQVVFESAKDELSETLSYHVSTALEAKCIPAYVRTGSGDTVQMLYNANTAKLMFNIVRDTAKLSHTNAAGVPSWNDTLSKNGYSNLQTFRHEPIHVGHQDAMVEVVTGIVRKSDYNTQEKFNIVVGIRAEETKELQTALRKEAPAYVDGIVSCFYENARTLYERLSELSFSVPEAADTENGKIIRYSKIKFSDIVADMQDADSRYTVTLTGSGLGGSIACILAAVMFPDQGVYEGNMNCYAFGAYGVANTGSYGGTNIFQVKNADDRAGSYPGKVLPGTGITYQPDADFKKKYYGTERRADFQETAHSMAVYQGLLEEIERNTARYAVYNTESPGHFYGRLVFDKNCYASFQNLTSDSILEVEPDTALLVRNHLRVRMLDVAGTVKVHGTLQARYAEIKNGIVSVDGNCRIACIENGADGYLTITGDEGRLELNGDYTIPYFKYTRETEKHIYIYD